LPSQERHNSVSGDGGGQNTRRNVRQSSGADEKVDLLVQKAEQAMRDRISSIRRTAGAELYRSALLIGSTTASRQGLQRLAEVLFTRSSPLGRSKFGRGLQSLEPRAHTRR